jgi:hypothetical protein
LPGRDRRQHPVDFDRYHGTGTGGEGLGERACAAADLKDDVAGSGRGGIEQQSHEVQVDQEVLAEPPIRRNARSGKQLLDLPFGLHQ